MTGLSVRVWGFKALGLWGLGWFRGLGFGAFKALGLWGLGFSGARVSGPFTTVWFALPCLKAVALQA